MARVVVSGASGLVGGALVPFLRAGGREVTRLVRRRPAGSDEIQWDPASGMFDTRGIEGADAVVHLCGENIAGGPWTEARKRRLWASRVDSTRLLAQGLASMPRGPRALIVASAVGYYGSRGEAWLTEQDPPGSDFLARLSLEWEAAAERATTAGMRVVRLRLGIVLSPAGGVLRRILPPFRLGLGGVLGSGVQYMSWIAIDDVLGAIEHALRSDDLAGAVNVVAPEPVTNAAFTKTLGRVLRRPTFARVPALLLRAALGEMADATLLASTRVRPERLVASGYAFRFPDLEGALRHVLARAT